jgi:hypothetical protein
MKKYGLALFILLLLCSGVDAKQIRVRKSSGLQKAVNEASAGDTIVLRKGVYRLKESLCIEGKENLVILGEGATLSGGERISRWRLRRARGYAKGVRTLNLGRYPLGAITPKGDPHLTGPSWSELYADGVPMHLSQWPDDSPLALDTVIVPGRGYIRPQTGEGYGVIGFIQDRPLEWKDPQLAWLWGCFRFGWTTEMVPVAHIGEDKTMEIGSLTNYGFGKQEGEKFQRWKILNIPEEVTLPGEYALDTERKRAWLMLPKGTRRVEISLLKDPLVKMTACNGVVISGVEFTCSRGDAVVMLGCQECRIQECNIHGMGHVAAVIDSACRRSGLSGCELFDLGAGAVELDGGDRRNIVRGDNYVENCIIHNFNRIEMQFRVGVAMKGLGNRLSGCEFYHSATMAILMQGNDQTVEYNNVHHVCLDIEDNGALYYGRDPSMRGSVIRWNYFHDIEVPFNVRAVYHDDGSGAAEVYGNIFRNITTPPVQIGGGSDIRYHDNIFMDLPNAAVKTDGRLKTWGADRLIAHRENVAKVDGPAFRAHYPEFASYYEGDPAEPQRNVFIRNVFYNVRWAFEKVVWSDHYFNDDISGPANFISHMSDNWKTTENPGFVEPANPLAGFVDHPALLEVIPGFVLPDVKRIPPTSDVSGKNFNGAYGAGKEFSGIVSGVADEAHTPAGNIKPQE